MYVCMYVRMYVCTYVCTCMRDVLHTFFIEYCRVQYKSGSAACRLPARIDGARVPGLGLFGVQGYRV